MFLYRLLYFCRDSLIHCQINVHYRLFLGSSRRILAPHNTIVHKFTRLAAEYLYLCLKTSHVHTRILTVSSRKIFRATLVAKLLYAVALLTRVSALNRAIGVLAYMSLVICVTQKRIIDIYGSHFFFVISRTSHDSRFF